MIPEALYRPSPWQSEYHNTRVDELLGAGSAGPGKTQTLIADPIFQVATEHDRCINKNHPHRLMWGQSVGWALHLRRHQKTLDQTIQRTKRLYPQIDPQARWWESDKMWEFRSGMRLQFGHCANPSDYENFMSNEYTHVAFDELTAFEEEQYEQITTRKRTTDPVLRRMMRCVSMSNPMMRMEDDAHKTVILKNPHWVRERFVDPAPQGRVMLKQKAVRGDGRVEWLTRIYLPAKLRDNPNKEFVEQYERSLIGKPPHIRKALLEGDWYVTAGSHYADVWNPSLHTCSPHRIPDDWPQFRCMDWGFKKPGCVYWMAVDPDDNLIVHKEYTFQGKTDKYVAHDIRDIERELGLWRGNRSGITGPADTQIWEKRGDSGKSKAEVFAEHGITWTFADKRSRQRNSERLYARLQDHGEGTTTPGIVFFTSCKMALKTIPSIQSDPDNQECPMDGGDDHWHDAVGYGVAYASHGRSGIGDTRQWDDYDDDDSPLNASRGRNGYGSMY